jgi:DNA-binding NarL/FixJ family response regulator
VQILQCLTAGMSNKEIAETISYSESTVKNRISKLLSDLDLKDRTQLALFALKHHLT